MIIIDKRIADLVPAHYREYAPRFITFLEKYYEWLYRASGLTENEIEDLRNDTSWLEKDIDRFISTGKLRYFDQEALPTIVEDAIIDINNTANPGIQSSKMPDSFTMEDDFNGYHTSDGSEITDANDITVELSTVENQILDSWFNSMGFDRIKRSRIEALNNIDQVLMLSLLKHIYAIKGTEASIKLFFNLFFDEQITIYQPKQDIAVIDDNWIIDNIQVIRDDELYQEYSYVILVNGEVEDYQAIFEGIYLKVVHPSGFRVELQKITP
jgi:hypothetical protein